jgi:hypothetical protein
MGSISGKGNRIVICPHRRDGLWEAPSLIASGYREFFPKVKNGRGVNLISAEAKVLQSHSCTSARRHELRNFCLYTVHYDTNPVCRGKETCVGYGGDCYTRKWYLKMSLKRSPEYADLIVVFVLQNKYQPQPGGLSADYTTLYRRTRNCENYFYRFFWSSSSV